MGNTLVIVESPAKARTVERYLGPGYKVVASVGHVKDLPKSKLGVDIERDFEPEYVPIKGKGKILREIRRLAKGSDRVLLAPDPDREGEAIAWHLADEVSRHTDDVQRILIHEITASGVAKALASPLPLNRKLYESQQARRILDRLVGYQISPLLWEKVRRGLSAGRVQSVAVRLVVDREAEIQAFDPEEYWTLVADVTTDDGATFSVKLAQRKGRKHVPRSKAEADAVLDAARAAAWRVSKVDAKEQKKSPPPPFTTAKLQQDAARLLRFSAKRTMGLAQSLYQGVDIGAEGPTGLITYMRTDSTRLSNDALAMARETIEQRFGAEFLPDKPRRFRSRKRAQDAHEAIRPTAASRTPESLSNHLERDQLRLYRLIYNRFLASQMEAARYHRTQVAVEAGDYQFRASGQVQTFPGYTRLYTEGQEPEERARAEAARKQLPALKVDDALALEQLDATQNFTQPPPRFTEASLVRELEERGIGRPSTYAAIISNVQDRGYVRKAEGRFRPTELGTLVTQLLVESFPDILNVRFTAQLEDQLDQVEEGDAEWLAVLRSFYTPFATTLAEAKGSMRDVKREEIPTDIVCERCERTMVLRWGRNGSFLACSGYPECRNTKEYERDENGKVRVKPPETTDETCTDCGKPMLVKNGRYGRFLACSGYPECRQTRPISLGIACPQPDCEGTLTEKRSRKGKVFYSCSRYPDCTYALWDRPQAEPCPQCKHPFVVFREARGRGRTRKPEHIGCPACDYRRDP